MLAYNYEKKSKKLKIHKASLGYGISGYSNEGQLLSQKRDHYTT